MDKKKLARLLVVIGGILLVVAVALWFIPCMDYTYTAKVDRVDTVIEDTISPMGYFAQGAAVTGYFYKNVMVVNNPDYNTNQDMYWLAFGVVFAVVGAFIAYSNAQKLAVKIICTIFAGFVLAGTIMAPVFALSPIGVLYIIVAALAFIPTVAGLVLDLIYG